MKKKNFYNKESYKKLGEKIEDALKEKGGKGDGSVYSFLISAFDKDNWVGFLDDLSQLFLLKLETDVRSTSSQDDYGLRNKCKKVIEFLINNQLGLNVKDLIYYLQRNSDSWDGIRWDNLVEATDRTHVYTEKTAIGHKDTQIKKLLELFRGFRGHAKTLIRDGVISDFIPKRDYSLSNHSSGNTYDSREEENWDEDNPDFFYNHLDSPYIASELEKQWNSYIQTHEKKAYLNSLQRCRKIVKKMEKGYEEKWESRKKLYARKLAKANTDEMAEQLFRGTINSDTIKTKREAEEILNESNANFLNENSIEEEERKLILLHLEVSDTIAEAKKNFSGHMVKNGNPLLADRYGHSEFEDSENWLIYPYEIIDGRAFRDYPQHYKSRLEIGWEETCRMIFEQQRRIEKRANGSEKDGSPTIATADSDSKGSAKNINFFEINHRYLDALEKFFEKVYVEDERPMVRERRLNLLAGIEKNMGIGFEIRQMKSEIHKGEGT